MSFYMAEANTSLLNSMIVLCHYVEKNLFEIARDAAFTI